MKTILFLITYWGIHFCWQGKQLITSCLFEVRLLVCSHLPRGRKLCPWCRCYFSEVRMVKLWVGMQQRRFMQTGLQQWLLQAFIPFHEEQCLVCSVFPQTHQRQTCASVAICFSHFFMVFLFNLNLSSFRLYNYFLRKNKQRKSSCRLDVLVDYSFNPSFTGFLVFEQVSESYHYSCRVSPHFWWQFTAPDVGGGEQSHRRDKLLSVWCSLWRSSKTTNCDSFPKETTVGVGGQQVQPISNASWWGLFPNNVVNISMLGLSYFSCNTAKVTLSSRTKVPLNFMIMAMSISKAH